MKKRTSKILICLNVLLLLIASINIYKFYIDDIRIAENTSEIVEVMEDSVVEDESESIIEEPYKESVEAIDIKEEQVVEMTKEIVDGYEYIGLIEIPTTELKLPVQSDWSDEKLEISPFRFTGSIYTNDLVIAGHNYKAHFSLIKWLEIGDPIQFIDVLGKEYNYEVIEMEIVQPEEVERMITGDWDLTLFTCTTGGQARMAIRCKLLEE